MKFKRTANLNKDMPLNEGMNGNGMSDGGDAISDPREILKRRIFEILEETVAASGGKPMDDYLGSDGEDELADLIQDVYDAGRREGRPGR